MYLLDQCEHFYTWKIYPQLILKYFGYSFMNYKIDKQLNQVAWN